MPASTTTCPGCGAVLSPLPEPGAVHPGASPSCARLFAETLRGLREEAADPQAAASVGLADAAYDAQHPDPADPGRLDGALRALAARFGTGVDAAGTTPPTAWQTTIADVAADLDVIDLPVLVDSWARTVAEDWAASHRRS